jgi:phospholipase C
MGALAGIEHVIVLMLENRSFDCMFGELYPKSASFDGLDGSEGNPFHKPDGTIATVPVWNDDGMPPEIATIPDPDPGELFTDINAQLFGASGVLPGGPPPMSGFVQNYIAQPQADRPFDPRAVMHHFTPRQVPVISTLAKAFGVCDQWFAPAPCQTWPNRFFVHSGTCQGHVNNSNFSIPYKAPTIFGRLRDKGKSWRIYYHDVPQTATLSDIWLEALTHFRHFDDFIDDARNGALPNYSFIEPRYFTDSVLGIVPNDQHPPHNVAYGEQLIADVYNAVRSAATWKKTLLVITYDEHGGIYDHVPPPAAVPPDALRPDGFAFDRYGVRVPAVIISPYMPPGSIVRAVPTGLPPQGPSYPFIPSITRRSSRHYASSSISDLR